MPAYSDILCPIDASECSVRALAAAAALAHRFDAKLTVFHAYHVPAYVEPGLLVWAALGPRPLWEVARERAHTVVAEFLARYLPNPDRAPESVIELGDPATLVLERARRGETDLIVMGTHGRTGARRWMLGSVAERVVRLAPCPVLVLPLHDSLSRREAPEPGQGSKLLSKGDST